MAAGAVQIQKTTEIFKLDSDPRIQENLKETAVCQLNRPQKSCKGLAME
jgi:hypothetical protein